MPMLVKPREARTYSIAEIKAANVYAEALRHHLGGNHPTHLIIEVGSAGAAFMASHGILPSRAPDVLRDPAWSGKTRYTEHGPDPINPGRNAAKPATAPPLPDPDDDYGPANKPGALMHWMLEKVGYKAKPGCGCASFARQMNVWGWKVCLTEKRSEIVAWFAAKARESGLAVSDDAIWSLFKAGAKDRLQAACTSVVCSKTVGGLLKLIGV